MKLNPNLLKATAVGALGGLLFGFDTAVIAGTTHSLTLAYALTPRQLGVTVAMALIGTVIGAMSAGIPGQKYGARETLRVLAVFYVLSALGCAFAWSWDTLLLARFLGGLGIGGSSVLGPVYIAELAPPRIRGRLVGMFQINIVIGILLAYLSNFVIARQGLGAVEWRWQFGVAALPAVLFLQLRASGKARKNRAAVRLEIPLADFSRHHHRHVQPALRHQRHPLLPQRHFRRRRIQQAFRRSASRGRRRHEFARNASRHVRDRQAGTENPAADWFGWHRSVPGRCRARFSDSPTSGIFAVVPGGVHRIFRHFARCGHLGLYQRSFSKSRARQGPGAGQFLALGDERHHRLHLPAAREIVGRVSIHVFLRDDGPAILRGPIFLPGDQARHPRTNAAAPRNRVMD